MKKIVFYTSLVVLLITLATSSCEKTKTSEELLIGKWEMQFLHIVSYVDNVILNDSTTYYIPGNSWIEFEDNNTGQVYIKDQQNDGFNWSVNGDNVTIKFTTGAKNTVISTFSVSETQLTWYNTMNEGAYIKDYSKTYKEVWYLWAIKI